MATNHTNVLGYMAWIMDRVHTHVLIVRLEHARMRGRFDEWGVGRKHLHVPHQGMRAH